MKELLDKFVGLIAGIWFVAAALATPGATAYYTDSQDWPVWAIVFAGLVAFVLTCFGIAGVFMWRINRGDRGGKGADFVLGTLLLFLPIVAPIAGIIYLYVIGKEWMDPRN